MSSYRLSTASKRDLLRIRKRLTREASERVADHVEARLFREFEELVRLPQIGHLHESVTQPNLRFHTVWEYEIVFLRGQELVIVRVLHGRRDLTKLL